MSAYGYRDAYRNEGAYSVGALIDKNKFEEALILEGGCSVLRYLSVTIVTLYPVRHDRYMIVKVHSYVKVILLIPSTVL